MCRNQAYLNHAGVAPLSARAAEALRAATEECLSWGAGRYDRLMAGVARARSAAAEFLQVAAEEIAFVKNTSEGIAFIAEGFPWQAGDRVVVPEGEFPSNVYPWMHLQRRGVELVRVPLREGRLCLGDFAAALSADRVRVLAVSSVEFENGFRNDLGALGEMCRQRDIFFFVDAIQSLGCLPFAPGDHGIHALAADAHKWLLGPEGVGILYLAREAWDRILPLEVGWKTVVEPLEFSRIRFEIRADAAKFEAGTMAVIPILALGEAFRLLTEVGTEWICRSVFAHIDLLVEELRRRGYRIGSSLEVGERSGILSFAPNRPARDLAAELLAAGVFVAARGDGLRVSPHFYNDRGDLERFLAALDERDR